jgi:sulfoxide reductase heme-binding subunit YedZ
MSFVAKIVANKLVAWLVILGVGVWFLVLPLFGNELGANPVEKLLHVSGEIAIWTLGALLTFTPLRVLFPRSDIIAALNRHRRLVGVAACVYGLIHFSLHLLYEGTWAAVGRSFSKPFIWLGAGGLIILMILSLTSNQIAMRLLRRNWKRLHRFAYLAAVLVMYHQAIAGKGHWRTGRWLVLPLAALQIARVGKNFVSRGTRGTPRVNGGASTSIQPELSAI